MGIAVTFFNNAFGEGDGSETAGVVIGGGLGLAASDYFVYQIVFANGPSYEDASHAARIYGATLGFLVLLVSILVYRHFSARQSA